MSEILNEISASVRSMQSYRRELNAEAEAWVQKQMQSKQDELDQLVYRALDEGEKIIAIAEAYTVSGKTPNRNAIHAIKNRRKTGPSLDNVGAYPFRWSSREVETATGTRWAWDIVAKLEDFGPEAITGDFRWKVFGGELDPVLNDNDPYPNSKYYQTVLRAWLDKNPYPGE